MGFNSGFKGLTSLVYFNDKEITHLTAFCDFSLCILSSNNLVNRIVLVIIFVPVGNRLDTQFLL